MDLRQLTYFVAVGDAGGIRAAARRLGISQPQVSQALRRLERELGVELMRRTARGTELTAEGDELLSHGRDILDRVGVARSALRQMAQERSATLRVGVVAGVLSAGELLAPILMAYRQACPDVELRLRDLSFADQSAWLLADEVDVAIVRLPLSHPGLDVTPLAEEPRVLMVGLRHELANEREVHVDDILGYPTLPLESSPDWAGFWQLDDFRGGPNCPADVPPVANVPAAQLAIATRNLMVSSPGTLGRLALNPLIRVIGLCGATPTVIAVVRKRGDNRQAVRRFVEAACDVAERDIGLLPAGALPS